MKWLENFKRDDTRWLWNPAHLGRPDTQSKDRLPSHENLQYVNSKILNGGCNQNSAAFYVIEHYVADYDFEYVVEIGSSYGGLSVYLANMAGSIGRFMFETYEINKKEHWNNKGLGGIGAWFEKIESIAPNVVSYETNIFSRDTIDHIKRMIDGRKTLILCDGGNKAQEFKTFAPILKPGDCIAVHDWGYEIKPKDIEHSIRENNMKLDERFEPSFTVFKTRWMPFVKEE